MPEPVIRARNLRRSFGTEGGPTVTAVRDASLDLHPGEMLAIQGPSGSGKTTLLAMLGAMIRPAGGDLTVDGRPLADRSDAALAAFRLRAVGFVFQYAHLLDALTVLENVELPLQLAGSFRPASTRRAKRLLDALELTDRARARPATLSGGERQRVAIARALANGPRVLLADEPTGSLDSASGAAVLELLASLARDGGRPVVVVSHDPRVSRYADRTLVMQDGVLSTS